MTTKTPNKADLLVYKALKTAISQDKLRIYLDYGKINRPQSPVYDPWESLLPVLVPVLIGLALILLILCVTAIAVERNVRKQQNTAAAPTRAAHMRDKQ